MRKPMVGYGVSFGIIPKISPLWAQFPYLRTRHKDSYPKSFGQSDIIEPISFRTFFMD